MRNVYKINDDVRGWCNKLLEYWNVVRCNTYLMKIDCMKSVRLAVKDGCVGEW